MPDCTRHTVVGKRSFCSFQCVTPAGSEAFIKLAENGLIQIRPQRGSYVNKISMAQVRNGSFIRQAIECAVARRAASMITESQCYQLEQNLHQQRIAIERKQLDDFLNLMTTSINS